MSAVGRIRLRPDRSCVRVLVAIVALALAAVNYESNTAWLMACLVAALGLVSILHTRRNLRGVSMRPQVIAPVFAGDPISIPVDVATGNTAVYAVQVIVGASQTSTMGVAAEATQHLLLLHPGLARGRHRLAAPELRSGFPLGLVQARLRSAATVDVVVYPRPSGRALGEAATVGASTGDGLGGLDGGDFAGHRRWQPGDNQRRVDWRALARGRPLLVKQFAGSSAECVLDWDATDGDDETRLSQLARWVLDADAMGWRYGLRLPRRSLTPAIGGDHRHQCLEALATFGHDVVQP